MVKRKINLSKEEKQLLFEGSFTQYSLGKHILDSTKDYKEIRKRLGFKNN